jgi:hypothetical protein
LIRQPNSLDLAAPQVIDDDTEVVELADGDLHVTANGGFSGGGVLLASSMATTRP